VPGCTTIDVEEVKKNESRHCRDAALASEPHVILSELIHFKGEPAPGTCKWIEHNVTFTSWLRSDDSGLLWIKGGPGKWKRCSPSY
jgi:hypothetical protein